MNETNLDDWLHSLGVDYSDAEARADAVADAPINIPNSLPAEEVNTSVIVSESPSEHIISDDEFNDILSNNGINLPQEASAEEIMEVSEDDESDVDIPESLEEEAESESETTNSEALYGTPQNIRELEQNAIAAYNEVTEGLPTEMIPPNSPTLSINTSTSRFSGAEWYEEIQKTRIIVAGIGGIGSNLVFQLARMCPETICLYDDDRVETVNMSGQLFSYNDSGKTKVAAMTDMIHAYTATANVYAVSEKFTADTNAGDIMMCGFDSMEARRVFYQSWLNHVSNKPEEERKKCLFLDGRLSIDTLQIFCITGDDKYSQSRYSTDYLFSDADADETVCSRKQTTYLACMIGSLMTNLFTNFVANTLSPVIPYNLPFFTEYDAQHMIFKIDN